ncbi:MAG: PAS domain S-box protein [Chloroflexota bacterium]
MIVEQQLPQGVPDSEASFIQSQFLDIIIEDVNVWLNLLDDQLNIILWNATAEKLSGYSREEVLGHSKVWEWLYPDEAYRQKITATTSAMINTSQALENFETKIRCKDGQIRTMSWNARHLLNEQGEIQGAINFGYDITERRREREALQAAHNELSVLYDIASIASSSPELDAILAQSLDRVLSAMKSHKGMVHLLNSETHTLHLTAQQGLSISVIAQLQDIPLHSDLVGRVFKKGEPMMVPNLATELSYLKSVPANLLHSYLGAPVRAKGKVLGVFSILGKGAQQFSPDEIALLTSIADQIGVAVENARLYQQSRQLAVLEERQRLARDLHDSVTQSLYSLVLFAETGRRTNSTGDTETTETHLAQLSKTAQNALKEMRLLVNELRPLALKEDGLIQTLQKRLDAVERRAGIKAHLLADALIELPLAVENELYYIIQEALNNSLKHSTAPSLNIKIQATVKQIIVEIVDNGLGFDTNTLGAGGVGLMSMSERAENLDGVLQIISNPDQGTTVKITVKQG